MSTTDDNIPAPEDDFDTDLGFDDTPNNEGKNNPLIKIALVAVGFVVVMVGIFYLGSSGSGTKTPPSQVAAVPEDTGAGGAQKAPTPEYQQAIVDYNQQQVDQAKQTGQSYIAITADPAQQKNMTAGADTTPAEDPAERFRQIQEDYARQQEQAQAKQTNEQAAADAAARGAAIQEQARAMSGYLSSIANTRTPKGMNEADAGFTPMQVSSSSPSSGMQTQGGGLPQGIISAQAAGGAQAIPPKVLIPAAKIEYGQLLIEANTDAPGPVLATLASGPLRGARLLGSFQKTEEYLTMNFNQLVTKTGKTMPIQAIAIDPGTTLPGIITEIDRRYFERYIIPAASDFVSGVGKALAETQTSTTQNASSTTTSSNDPDFSEAIAEGITKAFDGIGNALDNEASRVRPMLRVAAGTPIGVLFTQIVNDPDTITPEWQQQQLREQQAKLALQQQAQGNMGMIPYMTQMGAYAQPMYNQAMGQAAGMAPYGAGAGGSVPAAMMNAVTVPPVQ